MKKILPLAIGISILLPGCQSTPSTKKITEEEIPAYQTVISKTNSERYHSEWVQPENKNERCELLLEGYENILDMPSLSWGSSYQVNWNGSCQNGKATGLGALNIKTSFYDVHEISYAEAGIFNSFYFRSYKAGRTTQVQYGHYIHENIRLVKRTYNRQVLRSDAPTSMVMESGIKDLSRGSFSGTQYRKISSASNGNTETKYRKFVGDEGKNFKGFGTTYIIAESNLKSGIANYLYRGYYQTLNDQPDFLVMTEARWMKESESTFVENGHMKYYVQLPESFLHSVNKVTDEALNDTVIAKQAGLAALKMVNKYDAINQSHYSLEPNDVSKRPQESSPVIKQPLSTGTGFFISNDGYVLTNSHVVEGSSSISIILNGKSVSATLVDHDPSNDIALLKVDEAVEGLPIELKKKTKQGTEIAVLGYPNIGLQGNEQKATFGYINANSGIQGDTRYFQISSPIQPGNSGSPMVNDQGAVIGIASASLNQSAAIKATGTLAQNVNYAVKIAYALPMLINHGVDYIEPAKQEALGKTELIESISNSVVLVLAE